MYCHDTSCRSIRTDDEYSDSASRVLVEKAALWAGYLKEFVTPEDSTSDLSGTGSPRGRWLGFAKALFWTGASILSGLLLATLCR